MIVDTFFFRLFNGEEVLRQEEMLVFRVCLALSFYIYSSGTLKIEKIEFKQLSCCYNWFQSKSFCFIFKAEIFYVQK